MVIAIDCASRLNEQKATDLKNAGVQFIIRYLGDETSWKSMLLAEVEAIQKVGQKIISVFETNPTHRSYFTDLEAQQDAKNAAKYARSINQPNGTIIFFAVDYGATQADMDTIASYFNVLVDSLQGYEVGAYGSFDTEEYLKAHSKVKHFFQTYAWSGGHIEADAEVYQYLNAQNIAGISVDFDKINDPSVAWGAVEQISVTMPTALGSAPTETTKTVDVKPTTETVWVNYTVKSGDTVSQIALDHNATITEIERKNAINSKTDLIYDGQVIKVPEQKNVSAAPKPTDLSITWVNHTVKSGETVSGLAARYNTTIAAIESKNGINPATDVIYAGQVIKVPSTEKFVTVKSGDNLSKIAADNGLSLSQIEALNPSIKGPDYVIQPGEKVRVK